MVVWQHGQRGTESSRSRGSSSSQRRLKPRNSGGSRGHRPWAVSPIVDTRDIVQNYLNYIPCVISGRASPMGGARSAGHPPLRRYPEKWRLRVSLQAALTMPHTGASYAMQPMQVCVKVGQCFTFAGIIVSHTSVLQCSVFWIFLSLKLLKSARNGLFFYFAVPVLAEEFEECPYCLEASRILSLQDLEIIMINYFWSP